MSFNNFYMYFIQIYFFGKLLFLFFLILYPCTASNQKAYDKNSKFPIISTSKPVGIRQYEKFGSKTTI